MASRILVLAVLSSFSCFIDTNEGFAGGLPPAKSLAGFKHPNDLEITLFAAEPTLKNPTSIDIDHLGRIWVLEAVNYRHFRNTDQPYRAEGDRILILEDTDGDAKADKTTVFYQGTDIDGGHGVCVLGNQVIVTAPGKIFLLADTNNDDQADSKKLLFSCAEGVEHDHGLHAVVFGPDGKLYFNFGNESKLLADADGRTLTDLAGNQISDLGKPYRQGMVFRCDLDGSNVETLGWNFRNPWELAVDSFGNIWQSDNDDDGNRATRINFVMEYGNYGYVDEMTGAGWRTPRVNLEKEIPLQHWHLNDPGVIPNLLQTGAGAPTGILVYEGDALPDRYRNQLIHADALPNVVRGYRVAEDGAGYQASIEPIVDGSADQWFRPSDVAIAPDGSLFIADWYDPGVGGHRMEDVNQGRIFRVTTPDNAEKYTVPQFRFDLPDDAVAALQSPALSVRYLAWTALHKMGADAQPALGKLWNSENPRFRARALWLLGKSDNGKQWVEKAIADPDHNIRVTGIRLARQLARAEKLDLAPVVEKLAHDKHPHVRRECAIALREVDTVAAKPVWQTLAKQHDGQDRWYLEALGISAAGRWTEFFDAVSFLKSLAPESDSSPLAASTADLIWRSRDLGIPRHLTHIIGDPNTPESDLPRYFRAFDFQDPQAIRSFLRPLETALAQPLDSSRSRFIATQYLKRVEKLDLDTDKKKERFERLMKTFEGTPEFVAFVDQFELADKTDDLIQLAIAQPDQPLGVSAIQSLLRRKQTVPIAEFLKSAPPDQAARLAEAIGHAGSNEAIQLLLPIIDNEDADLELRRRAVNALARSRAGAARLLGRMEKDELNPSFTHAARAGLLANPDPQLKPRIDAAFPPSKENKNPLPPIAELAKRQGDAILGRMVYVDAGTCVKCHKFHGIGQNIGPDLSEIGDKLSREALLESILFPSAGISHNYESYVAITEEGTVVTGLLVSRTPQEVVLKGADAIEHRLPRESLEELIKQDISLMPDDIHRILTEEQIVDLVEFLTTLKK